MAKKHGRLVRIKIGNDASPEVFTAIAGARTDSLSFNNGEIDITEKDDLPWRQLLEGGIQSLSMSCSGLLETDRPGIMSGPDLVALAMAGTIKTMQLDVSGIGTFQGDFQIRSFEIEGSHEDAATFSASFESSGLMAFTAA